MCSFFFAFCFYPSDPYVKFAFRLFQGQIADCRECKFELRFFKLASPGTGACSQARHYALKVSSSVPSSACKLLFSFAC